MMEATELQADVIVEEVTTSNSDITNPSGSRRVSLAGARNRKKSRRLTLTQSIVSLDDTSTSTQATTPDEHDEVRIAILSLFSNR